MWVTKDCYGNEQVWYSQKDVELLAGVIHNLYQELKIAEHELKKKDHEKKLTPDCSSFDFY